MILNLEKTNIIFGYENEQGHRTMFQGKCNNLKGVY